MSVLHGDVKMIPFARRLRAVLGRRQAGNDAAGIVIGQPRPFLLATGIVDLHFDPLLDRVGLVADVEVEAGVALRLDFVVEGVIDDPNRPVGLMKRTFTPKEKQLAKQLVELVQGK